MLYKRNLEFRMKTLFYVIFYVTLLYNYVKTPYLTKQTFTCSKSIIETLEKGLTYV